jgi:hypothetical protein
MWYMGLMQNEAARSRFDPGNRLLWDIRVLFKTHKFIMKVRIGKSTSFLFTLLIPALGSRLETFVACVWGSCGRMDIGWPTEWLTLVARRILTNQLRPCSQAIPAWLWIFATRDWRKPSQRYPRDSFGSIKVAGRMCVCSGGTASDLTTVKIGFFSCNFDFGDNFLYLAYIFWYFRVQNMQSDTTCPMYVHVAWRLQCTSEECPGINQFYS